MDVRLGDKMLVVDIRADGSAQLYKLGGKSVPRGSKSRIGDTRVAPNGYHYTRTSTGWRLTHHIILEEDRGRPLGPDERCYFIDGDRTNITVDNIGVKKVKPRTNAAKRAAIEAKIEDLKHRLDELADIEGA